jgi:hypothetical protein
MQRTICIRGYVAITPAKDKYERRQYGPYIIQDETFDTCESIVEKKLVRLIQENPEYYALRSAVGVIPAKIEIDASEAEEKIPLTDIRSKE